MQNDDESDYNTKTRYDFFQGAFRSCARILLVMAIWAVGEVWKDLYVAMHPAAPPVIGLYPDGRLQQAVVLDQPIIDDIAMKAWTERAVERTCNLDFMNWERQLNDASEALLPAAVNGLKSEMVAKNIVNQLKSDRLLEWCRVGTSWIVKKDLVNNALYYELKMPLSVRFMGQNEVRDHSSRQMMRVVVLQVDRSIKPRGFAIASMQAEPEKAPIDGAP